MKYSARRKALGVDVAVIQRSKQRLPNIRSAPDSLTDLTLPNMYAIDVSTCVQGQFCTQAYRISRTMSVRYFAENKHVRSCQISVIGFPSAIERPNFRADLRISYPA